MNENREESHDFNRVECQGKCRRNNVDAGANMPVASSKKEKMKMLSQKPIPSENAFTYFAKEVAFNFPYSLKYPLYFLKRSNLKAKKLLPFIIFLIFLSLATPLLALIHLTIIFSRLNF